MNDKQKTAKDRESEAFNKWFDKNPTWGNTEEVQEQWESSSDFQDFIYAESELSTSACSGLNREEWLWRCAVRFMQISAVNLRKARMLAETQLENLNGDLSESPEDAADDEMSYWGAD
jgi:hypothetical protein